jgi:sugar transferase (PEP-CTERM/EpsH1 system associated)
VGFRLDYVSGAGGVAPVIHILHLAYAVSRGGAANVIVTLCNRLDPERFRTSIITMTPNGGFERLLAPRITLRRELARRGIDPSMVFRIARHLRELRPDVIHTHAWGALSDGMAAGWLAHVPAQVHLEHGTLELRPLQRRVQRWAWGRLDQVVAVSEALRRRMEEHIGFPADRIRVIPNGIDTDRIVLDAAQRQRVRSGLGAGPQDFVIGAVGRMHPVKGHAFLVESLGLLPPHVRLWLVGDGELHPQLEARARSLGLADRVRFLGHRDDVHDLLPAMDAYCQPSLSEGISMALLEAMAGARPVVVTAVGGNREVVTADETGLLVEPGQPQALADAVNRIASQPTLATRLGDAARRCVLDRYSWSGMVRQYEALYTELAARPKRAGRG